VRTVWIVDRGEDCATAGDRNKARLDEAVGKDSSAFEIVGKPYDLGQIMGSIDSALNQTCEVEATSRR
jgi:hypothetical protein